MYSVTFGLNGSLSHLSGTLEDVGIRGTERDRGGLLQGTEGGEGGVEGGGGGGGHIVAACLVFEEEGGGIAGITQTHQHGTGIKLLLERVYDHIIS